MSARAARPERLCACRPSPAHPLLRLLPLCSYGFMLAVYVILAIVVSCVTVVSTYFLLNAEGE